MLLAVAKITISVFAVMAMGLCLAYILRRAYRRSSTRLFAEGYILTHPRRAAVAFSSAEKAKQFAERATNEGVIFSVYKVSNGKVVYICKSNALIIEYEGEGVYRIGRG